MVKAAFESGPHGLDIAYLKDGAGDEFGPCGFFWLGGFMSDMTGTKAEALAEAARVTRRTLLRFDYAGHGQSEGDFEDGTISLWLEQATHMFLAHTHNRRIIIGSSMGGWLALLLVRRLQKEDATAFRRIGGLVLVAPATDMTTELMWNRFSEEARRDIVEDGVHIRPSDYGTSYAITRQLIEDGNRHLLLPGGQRCAFPVRILQGSEDRDVPPAHAVKTFEALKGNDVALTFIKGGDHRLSTQIALRLLQDTTLQLARLADGDAL